MEEETTRPWTTRDDRVRQIIAVLEGSFSRLDLDLSVRPPGEIAVGDSYAILCKQLFGEKFRCVKKRLVGGGTRAVLTPSQRKLLWPCPTQSQAEGFARLAELFLQWRCSRLPAPATGTTGGSPPPPPPATTTTTTATPATTATATTTTTATATATATPTTATVTAHGDVLRDPTLWESLPPQRFDRGKYVPDVDGAAAGRRGPSVVDSLSAEFEGLTPSAELIAVLLDFLLIMQERARSGRVGEEKELKPPDNEGRIQSIILSERMRWHWQRLRVTFHFSCFINFHSVESGSAKEFDALVVDSTSGEVLLCVEMKRTFPLYDVKKKQTGLAAVRDKTRQLEVSGEVEKHARTGQPIGSLFKTREGTELPIFLPADWEHTGTGTGIKSPIPILYIVEFVPRYAAGPAEAGVCGKWLTKHPLKIAMFRNVMESPAGLVRLKIDTTQCPELHALVLQVQARLTVPVCDEFPFVGLFQLNDKETAALDRDSLVLFDALVCALRCV